MPSPTHPHPTIYISYYENKVSHSRDFSAILTATQHEALRKLFHDEIIGRLPLPKKNQESVLKFQLWKEKRVSSNVSRSSLGFVVEDEVRPMLNNPVFSQDNGEAQATR